MLAFESVSKQYDSTKALDALSFSVSPGELLAFTGPRKAGKTTIMRLLLRAEAPTQGRVSIDGINLQSVPPSVLRLYRQRLGILLQEGNLLLHRTVTNNLSLPLLLRHEESAGIRRTVSSALAGFGLQNLADRRSSTLSRRDERLVGLLRATLGSPMILLLDDPFDGLSESDCNHVWNILKPLKAAGTTIIFFAHALPSLPDFSPRVLSLAHGVLTSPPAEPASLSLPLQRATHHILARVLLRSEETKDEPVLEKIRIAKIG